MPTVDITMRIEEGQQYFVNRIMFTGNTTTRDNVIRREMRLLEGDVFNTEALKYSVRRLNQLGYFKQLEGNEKDMKVDKTPDRKNAVDVTVKLEEQNRNQLTFGAGVSQYEGVFGQLAFQTANFLGRGESLTVSMTGRRPLAELPAGVHRAVPVRPQHHRRLRHLQAVAAVHRLLHAEVHRRQPDVRVPGRRLQPHVRQLLVRDGEDDRPQRGAHRPRRASLGPTGCSIISSLGDLSQLTPTQVEVLRRNPFIYDSLLLGQGGARTISKVMPSFVHNTVDNPIFPNTGKRLTASIDLAVLGGNTQFYKPRVEGISFLRHTAATSVGFRGQVEYIAPVGQARTSLPIFERLFLGGEYSVRGFDIRSIGPTVPGSLVVLGGNKSLLFNAEYMFSIASQVRIVGVLRRRPGARLRRAVRVEGRPCIEFRPPSIPPLRGSVCHVAAARSERAGVRETMSVGRRNAFKTSTGVELRFFMPVLNVPFRLIYAFNPSRAGVLDNELQPAKDTTFRFAVGTTF